MRKLLVALGIWLGLLSAPAHAQWVVIDPANLMQNIMNVYSTIKQEVTSASMLMNQYRQLEYDLMQLKKIGSGDVSGLLGSVTSAIGVQEQYIGAVKGLYGDVGNAKTMATSMFDRMAASGLSPDEWFGREADRNRANQEGNGFLSDYQANVLKQVGQRYEQVRDLQGKITETEGTHEAMQLMNSQMNVLIATMNQVLEQNAAMAQRSVAKDVMTTGSEKRQIDSYKSWQEAENANREAARGMIQRVGQSSGQ